MDDAEEKREGENERKKYHLPFLLFSPITALHAPSHLCFRLWIPNFIPLPKKNWQPPQNYSSVLLYPDLTFAEKKNPTTPCNTTQCSERAATVDPRKKMKKKHDVVNLLPGGGLVERAREKKKSYIAGWEFYDAKSRTTSPCCRAAVAGRSRRRNKNRYDFVSWSWGKKRKERIIEKKSSLYLNRDFSFRRGLGTIIWSKGLWTISRRGKEEFGRQVFF